MWAQNKEGGRMKKYFLRYICEDFLLFTTCAVVVLTPLLIINLIKEGINWIFTLGWGFSVYFIITEYIKFNPELWLRNEEISKRITSLSSEEKDKLLKQLKGEAQ